MIVTLVAFDYSQHLPNWLTKEPQSYALAHKSSPKAVQNLQKCTRGAPRGVRGVILFSELHLNFFSQNFWGFGGVHTGLCNVRFLKGCTTLQS